jgi:hypothetical protein
MAYSAEACNGLLNFWDSISMSTPDSKSLQNTENEPSESANPPAATGSSSASYLVRFWLEPQGDGKPSLRGYVRHLGTGEESYVGDPTELGEHILKRLPEATADEEPEAMAAVEPPLP